MPEFSLTEYRTRAGEAKAMANVDGMTIPEYLNQSEVWLSKQDGPVRIDVMSDGHRALAARFLSDHATPFALLSESSMQEDILSDDGTSTLSDILDLMSANPKTWIRQTALYRALVKGLPDVR